MENSRQSLIPDLEANIIDLERAAAHLRHVIDHLNNGETPRACAHILAAQGHLNATQATIDRFATIHASKSSIVFDE